MSYVITIRTESETDVDHIKCMLEDALEDGQIEDAFDLHLEENVR